ncbi:MAG TPA: choice-of-anchor E domain-containing protein [Candidatus Binatia bacterium]
MIGHWLKRILQYSAWAILVAVELGSAEADQIIQTRDYGVVAGNVTVPVDLAFDQFDPHLGALSDVEFVFEFEVRSASIDFENTDASPKVAHVGIEKIVNYVGPGLLAHSDTALFDFVNLFEGLVNFGAFDGNPDFMGPDSFNFRQVIPVGHILSATPTSLSPYVGTNTVPLEIIGILGASISSGGLTNPSGRINGDELIGAVTLRYNFGRVAVPEPSMLSLVGIGLFICFSLFGTCLARS